MGKAFLKDGLLMPLDKNLLQLRKSRGFTQEQMADITGLHINSVKAYEAGRSMPSAEVIKKVALAFSVTTDELIFDKHERAPNQNLQLAFEAVSNMGEEDQQTIMSLIEGMILKHQAKTLFGARRAS